MTKRQELIKEIRKYAKKNNQEFIIKEGGSHTKVWLGKESSIIPRHKEISNQLGKKILKDLGIK